MPGGARLTRRPTGFRHPCLRYPPLTP